MENVFISPEEIIELLKKRIKNKNEEMNINNISQGEIDNFVVECEVDRFNDLFNQIFEEEILPFDKSKDCEDGAINEICFKIVSNIKESLEKIDKKKLLKFLFNLIAKLILENKEE